MPLNLSKIKQQAAEHATVLETKNENDLKIAELIDDHQTKIINFFKSSFSSEEKVLQTNGGSNHKVEFGSYSVQLQFDQSEFNKGIIAPSKKVNFYLSKYLDDKVLIQAKFIDETNYQSLNITDEDYSYTVNFKDLNAATTTFDNLPNILQEIINK